MPQSTGESAQATTAETRMPHGYHYYWWLNCDKSREEREISRAFKTLQRGRLLEPSMMADYGNVAHAIFQDLNQKLLTLPNTIFTHRVSEDPQWSNTDTEQLRLLASCPVQLQPASL